MIDSGQAQRILHVVLGADLHGPALRRLAMQELAGLPGWDWCGVYRLEGDALVLDEYVGAPTDHVRIPVGVGVCGTAVATGANQVVTDVRNLDNYLACSLSTRSEIVVLIRRGDAVLGQIDIDGHAVDAFGPDDERFLESLAVLLADRW
jgi:GAF domain-containing protein